ALSKVRAIDPHSRTLNSEMRGWKRAFSLFHEAARRVPAYQDFLKKNGVDPKKIETRADFQKLPLTTKKYFSDYSLKELSWDGNFDTQLYVSTSSGSTGVPFFWPRGSLQDLNTGLMFKRVYEDIFETKKGTTLAIDAFALGTWIAGFEFYNATKFAAENGN